MAAPGVIKITQKRVRPAEATSSSSSRSSSRPSKRYRKFGAGSGAPETRRDTEGRVSTAAHLAEHALSGSSYLSLRSLPLSAPPSLVNCCLRLSSVAIVDLALDMVLRLVQAKREDTIATLQLDDLAAIPTTIMARLAPRVLQEASKLDDHLGHVSTVLLNTFLNPTTSSSFALPPALSVSCTITSPVLRRIAQCTHLELLDLSAQASLKDAPLRGVLPRLHHLTKVVFKGCTQVGDETAKTISNHSTLHATLLHLNLNYTAITWQGLVKLLSSLRSLQVLKIASLNGITDKNISRMLDQVLAAISDPSFIPLSTLTVLKLKRTAIADAGVGRLLSHTPQLKSLDISWTSVKSLDVLSMSSASPLHSFTKLVLSGLNLRPNSLHQCFSQLSGDAPPGVEPRLETLKLGSLGTALSTVSSFVVSIILFRRWYVDIGSSRQTSVLTPDTLKKMIPPLSRLKHLTRISLFGNEKIGNNGAVLSDFLSRVGRRCIVSCCHLYHFKPPTERRWADLRPHQCRTSRQ